MNIALSNCGYRPDHSGGGDAHVEAFIREALVSGHELVGWPILQHPQVPTIPSSLVGTARRLRAADVLYVRLQDMLPKPTFSRWFGPIMKRVAGNPLLVWEFNTIPEQGMCIGWSEQDVLRHRAALARYAPQCDLAICVSRKIADYIAAHLGIKRSVVIPNGAYPTPPSAPAAKARDGLDLVWAGSAYIQWNAFDLLFEAARLLAASGSPIRFHLIGPGTEKLPNVPANVKLYGPMEHAVVKQTFARMHLALCLYLPGPADYSSSLKYFDYCGSGLPVITTPHPQMDELQREAQTDGLIVVDRSPATLAAMLRGLAENPSQLSGLEQKARALVEAKYNWPMLMRRLFTVLEAALNERKK